MEIMQSNIERLAIEKGFKNVQQFALQAALPWSIAKNIWQGDLSNRSLKTLVKAARALDCKLENLYESSLPDIVKVRAYSKSNLKDFGTMKGKTIDD